jgi:hypothetical protein
MKNDNPASLHNLDFNNCYDMKSLSGLDPYDIDNCKSGFITGFFEYFIDVALDEFKRASISKIEIQNIINEMAKFRNLGDFLLVDHSKQTCQIAAFLLIILDRLIILAKNDTDGWHGMSYLHAIYECIGIIEPSSHSRSILRRNTRKAAAVRHKENRELRTEAIAFYATNSNNYTTRIAAARAITHIVPVTERTADTWIKEYLEEQSASTL